MPSDPQQVQTIFGRAVQKPESERAEFLDRECAGDSELRCRVDALIAAHEHSGSFLDSPPKDLAATRPTIPPAEGVANTAEPTVGDKVRYFGDYELLEEIARGGMGVVYKARQMNLNRIVALKMILSGEFAGAEDVQRFHTEAEAAAALDHPGIVPIFEIGEHAGQHYFSMGYVEGESLAHKVADGPLPPREAAELVRNICDAMAYAHEQGVIHRDLKPSNILVDRNGQPKITDFGLAKRTQADSNLTGTGQILGTPAYMPPEQAAGKTEDVGTLADVYSLGAILYCLLTGRPPFQAASPMDTLLQVLDQDPVPLRQLNAKIPQDLESVVLKCLQKSPGYRYESSVSLRDELQRFLDGEPTLAKPVGSIRYAWNWYWHNLTKVAGTLAIVCSGFHAISFAVVLVQLFEATSEGPLPGANGTIENIFMSLMFMVPIAILALVFVLIGAKCGLLTLRGHKLGIVGSICILGFITLGIVSDFPKIPEDASSEFRRSATLLTSYAYIFAIWYAFCLLTQFLALLTPDQRASNVALADDVASIRRDRSRLVRSFIFMSFGVAMIASASLSDLTPPGISLAGLMLVVAGILIAFRLR